MRRGRADFAYWASRGSWTFNDLVYLLAGSWPEELPAIIPNPGEPIGTDFQEWLDVYKDVDVIFCWLCEDADSARKLGTLKPIGRIDDNEKSLDHWVFTERYRPTDLMTWIKSERHEKRLVIPEELERLFESDTKTAAPTPPVTPPLLQHTERSVEVDGGESTAGNKTPKRRKRGSTIAVARARDALRGELEQEPSIDQVWRYLKTKKSDIGIVIGTKDDHLLWMTSKGDPARLTRNTVANILSRLRSEDRQPEQV
jgi:hypothetical protein